jgi:hypothetical protein
MTMAAAAVDRTTRHGNNTKAWFIGHGPPFTAGAATRPLSLLGLLHDPLAAKAVSVRALAWSDFIKNHFAAR